MTKKIVLVGVPVETVYDVSPEGIVTGFSEKYTPGTLEKTLKILEKKAKSAGLNVVNKGELVLKHDRKGVVNVQNLLTHGEKLRHRHRDADRIIAIGPSHLGALIFYDDNETVKRFDFHGDRKSKNMICPIGCHAGTYMSAVNENFAKIDITNYGVIEGPVLGKMSHPQEKSKRADHFDIDLDVFDQKYQMNGSEKKSCYEPRAVFNMLCIDKPLKIGVWEYRPKHDKIGNSLNFLKALMNVPFKKNAKRITQEYHYPYLRIGEQAGATYYH